MAKTGNIDIQIKGLNFGKLSQKMLDDISRELDRVCREEMDRAVMFGCAPWFRPMPPPGVTSSSVLTYDDMIKAMRKLMPKAKNPGWESPLSVETHDNIGQQTVSVTHTVSVRELVKSEPYAIDTHAPHPGRGR